MRHANALPRSLLVRIVLGAALACAAIPAQIARPTPAAFATSLSEAELTKAAASGFPQTMNGVTVSDPDVHIETAGVRLGTSRRSAGRAPWWPKERSAA